MEVTVNMTAEEFMEFVAWRKEQDYYKSRMDKELNKREMLAKKTCWAIDADPKKPGKVKIIDQEHAAELLEMAKDYMHHHMLYLWKILLYALMDLFRYLMRMS